MAAYGELMVDEGVPTPALYCVERGAGDDYRGTVVYVWTGLTSRA